MHWVADTDKIMEGAGLALIAYGLSHKDVHLTQQQMEWLNNGQCLRCGMSNVRMTGQFRKPMPSDPVVCFSCSLNPGWKDDVQNGRTQTSYNYAPMLTPDGRIPGFGIPQRDVNTDELFNRPAPYTPALPEVAQPEVVQPPRWQSVGMAATPLPGHPEPIAFLILVVMLVVTILLTVHG